MLCFGFVFVYFFIPETKGLSLEEVDELYRAHVSPRAIAKWRPAGALAAGQDLKVAPETRQTGALPEKSAQEHRETV
jgi:hypothetical protein